MAVVADLFHLIRGESGNDRSSGGRIQGIELVMDVLSGRLTRISFADSDATSTRQDLAPASRTGHVYRPQ